MKKINFICFPFKNYVKINISIFWVNSMTILKASNATKLMLTLRILLMINNCLKRLNKFLFKSHLQMDTQRDIDLDKHIYQSRHYICIQLLPGTSPTHTNSVHPLHSIQIALLPRFRFRRLRLRRISDLSNLPRVSKPERGGNQDKSHHSYCQKALLH